MRWLLYSVIFFCGIFPGCKKPQLKKQTFSCKTSCSKLALSPVAIQEAKLSDIPIPISAQSVLRYFYSNGDNYMLAYKDNRLSTQQIADFYEAEMERLGWRSVFAIKGYESVYQFEKPSRICILSIRTPALSHKSEWVISSGILSNLVS